MTSSIQLLIKRLKKTTKKESDLPNFKRNLINIISAEQLCSLNETEGRNMKNKSNIRNTNRKHSLNSVTSLRG